MLSWIQKTFRGYLGVGRDSDMGNRMSWSPWSVRKEHLWSPRKAACDAVTCSECPGGDRCCNHTAPSHPASSSRYVTYDDDGYPARRLR